MSDFTEENTNPNTGKSQTTQFLERSIPQGESLFNEKEIPRRIERSPRQTPDTKTSLQNEGALEDHFEESPNALNDFVRGSRRY